MTHFIFVWNQAGNIFEVKHYLGKVCLSYIFTWNQFWWGFEFWFSWFFTIRSAQILKHQVSDLRKLSKRVFLALWVGMKLFSRKILVWGRNCKELPHSVEIWNSFSPISWKYLLKKVLKSWFHEIIFRWKRISHLGLI